MQTSPVSSSAVQNSTAIGEIPPQSPPQNTQSTLTPAAPSESSCFCCVVQFFASLWNYFLSFFGCLPPVELSVEGDYAFDPDEIDFFKELFADKNVAHLKAKMPHLTVLNTPIDIQYSNDEIFSFKLSNYPGCAFRLDPSSHDQITALLKFREQVIEIHGTFSLNKLVFADCTQFQGHQGSREFSVLIEGSPVVPTPLIEVSDNSEQERIVSHLTVLICKAKCGRNAWKLGNTLQLENGDIVYYLDQLRPLKEGEILDELIRLMSAMPNHASLVYNTAKAALSPDELENIKLLLVRATNRLDYKVSTERYYKARGITRESPAIPADAIEKLLSDPLVIKSFEHAGFHLEPSKTIIKNICENINEIIARQTQSQSELVDARKWRLTPNNDPTDGDSNLLFFVNLDHIFNGLIPVLQKHGFLSFIFDDTQAAELGIQLKPGDKIVQF